MFPVPVEVGLCSCLSFVFGAGAREVGVLLVGWGGVLGKPCQLSYLVVAVNDVGGLRARQREMMNGWLQGWSD